jgi:hypothetical protein
VIGAVESDLRRRRRSARHRVFSAKEIEHRAPNSVLRIALELKDPVMSRTVPRLHLKSASARNCYFKPLTGYGSARPTRGRTYRTPAPRRLTVLDLLRAEQTIGGRSFTPADEFLQWLTRGARRNNSPICPPTFVFVVLIFPRLAARGSSPYSS